MHRLLGLALWLVASTVMRPALAQSVDAVAGDLPAPPPEPTTNDDAEPSTGRSPYSIPWQLRPALAVNVVRSDTSVALHDRASLPGPGARSTTMTTLLTCSTRLRPDTSVAVRYGWVFDGARPEGNASAFTNMAFSATFVPEWRRPFRVATTGGVVLPTAQGGGRAPEPRERRAISAGTLARSAMDNALFAPDDLTVFGGADLAWVEDDVTVQLEVTVFEAFRVKGPNGSPKTNSTWGAHVGYFIVPTVSVGTEIRYQLFLAGGPSELDRRDTTTAALGARVHLVRRDWAFRPGISYAHPLDDPMSAAGYRVVQLDLPLIL